MIHITLTLLLVSCVISPSIVVAFFYEGNGHGDGNGNNGNGGQTGGGSIPGIPIIPIHPQAKNFIQIKEFKINVGSINVQIDNRKSSCSNCCNSTLLGTDGGTRECIQNCITAGGNVITPQVQACINACVEHSGDDTTTVIPPIDSSTPVFPDSIVPNEPGSTEVVLGELDSNVTTQGLPGIPVPIGPIITSFTYKIENDKKGHTPVITFIIRGKGFDITSLLDPKLVKQLGSLVEPRVYLGNICLKVVEFCDTYIEARFEDIEDQKNFKAGPYWLVVKVLHVEKKIGVLSSDTTALSTLGGLTLPELQIIGPSFPVLPISQNPLISLFNGLKFDSATLLVTFSQNDADKIRAACKFIE